MLLTEDFDLNDTLKTVHRSNLMDEEAERTNANSLLQLKSNQFINLAERAFTNVFKRRTTITVYTGSNYTVFRGPWRESRGSSLKITRTLEGDSLYRNVYNKELADAGDRNAKHIKRVISENAGIDEKVIDGTYDLLGENKCLEKTKRIEQT